MGAKEAVMRFFYGEPQPEASEDHRTPTETQEPEEHRTPVSIGSQLASCCSSDSESSIQEISEGHSTPEIDDLTLADSPDTEGREKPKLSRREKVLLKKKDKVQDRKESVKRSPPSNFNNGRKGR